MHQWRYSILFWDNVTPISIRVDVEAAVFVNFSEEPRCPCTTIRIASRPHVTPSLQASTISPPTNCSSRESPIAHAHAHAHTTTIMPGPEVHHLFHHPIADHSFSADRQTLAVARENNVDLFQKTGSGYKLKDELTGHDKTVTGVDIAPNSGKIVTCSQGNF
jgi:hypothetical protein